MTRFLSGDLLWKAIAKRVGSSHRTKAAIAYVTRSLPLSFRSGDVLIVDATDHAISSGQTSAVVLEKLLAKKVQLYSHMGLHAKVLLLDDTLFASSANLSASSIDKLLEAGVETDNPNSVSAAAGLIERLIVASPRIDARFVARIKTIKVLERYPGATSKAKRSPRGYREPVTWFLGLHDVDDPTNPEELERIQIGTTKAEGLMGNLASSPSWIRYGRSDKISKNARQGDNLVIIRRSVRNGQPERVYRHAPLLLVQTEPKCVRLFYENVPNGRRRSLSWLQFKRLARTVGLPTSISGNSERQLTDKLSADVKDYWEQARAT